MTRRRNIIKDNEVLKSQIDMDLVVKLLQSEITSYRINKDTGFSVGTLSDLRTGKRKICNLNVRSAYLLSEYAKKTGIN